MSNNASGRDGWRVPASEASLATVSPIFDAMKQLTISPKVSYPCVSQRFLSLSPSLILFRRYSVFPASLSLFSTPSIPLSHLSDI